ncbi:FAD binding domain-containing protein [Methylopila sp. 73B]|uniref:FAD binding domain-containing protein n=1 Tax=Methylopila sp. 73B TaxID=1120792 RepID=UPI00036BAE9D|nr:FAD binding domain-containing protein [Methylopila sp. 73B]
MKPARFALERPRDLAAALALLAQAKGAAKVMAGGQSLGPMLNLRLAEPELIVDVSGVAELRHAGRDGDAIVYGACVTHADIEDGRAPDVGPNVMARVASGIAYRAVRNRGTLGGSLAHADPAADWLSSLSALGAEVEIAGPAGRRRLALPAFVTGALSTALEADEILIAVRVPVMNPSSRFGYVKHCRKVGEFAHAIGAVLIDPETATGRAVFGAVEAPPVVVDDARVLFGGRIRPGFADDFDVPAADGVLARAGMADAVDRHIHVEVLRRAALQAHALLASPLRPDVRSAA